MITSTMFFSFFRRLSAFSETKLGKSIIAAVIIALIVFVCFSVIAYKNNTIRQKEKEIAQYQENIKGLELQAQTLQNEILFIKENEKFQNSFSNSSVMIDNLFKTKIRPDDDLSSSAYREDLSIMTKEEHETFNSISNNFYKYFNSINIMSGTNKICQSTAFYASRNIYYKVSNKSAGFNEKISGKYYKNRRMAIMV